MDNIFLTGMGRSGTTLLEKLLTNHHQITMLSQPFPLLFTELKKRFLDTLGLNEYYVLNNGPDDEKYNLKDFIDFLNNYEISLEEISEIFKKMDDYSGQMTKTDWKYFTVNHTRFIDIYKSLLRSMLNEENIAYLGSKEILCEEYLPYFLQQGQKTIVIIRDPRDMLASANYPKGKKYLGNKKPSLFLLRSWRKSVEFSFYLKDNKNFYFLRYEDLVNHPYEELNKIAGFLGLEKFQKEQFESGIYDQKGELWSANTSFDNTGSFISKKSVEIYKDVLTKEEITYTEIVCENEMKWLGYNIEVHTNATEIIENFRDYDIQEHEHLPADFTSQIENIRLEIDRYEKYNKYYI